MDIARVVRVCRGYRVKIGVRAHTGRERESLINCALANPDLGGRAIAVMTRQVPFIVQAALKSRISLRLCLYSPSQLNVCSLSCSSTPPNPVTSCAWTAKVAPHTVAANRYLRSVDKHFGKLVG